MQDLFLPNSAAIFCHSQILLICLINLSLPNLYFYTTIRSMAIFLKVLNEVNIRALIKSKPKFLIITDSLSFAKLLQLQSLLLIIVCPKEASFFILSCWSSLKFWLKLAWVCTFPQFSLITRSGLEPFPGYRGSCSIVANGPPGLVVFFNIRQGLKCYHVASTLTLIMLQPSPSLNQKLKLPQLLGESRG